MSPSDYKTLDTAFEAYLSLVSRGGEIPFGPVQVAEMKKCFVAGVFWLLTLCKTHVADMSEDEGSAFLEGVWAQCVAFGLNLPDNGPGGETDEPVQSSTKH